MAPFWHKLAACKQLGPHVFFGSREKTPMTGPEISNAKTLCTQCPVQRECLAFGLDEEWGVWGGFTRAERERAVSRVMEQMRVPVEQRKTDVRTDQAKGVVLRAFDTGHLAGLVAVSAP